MTSSRRRSSGDWIPATRFLFHFAGAISLLLLLLRFVPPAFQFARAELPQLGFLILSFFEPSYIYIIMNVVIISILASSRFNNSYESVRNCAVSESEFSDIDSDMKSESNRNSGGSSFLQVEEGEKEEEEVVVDESEWIGENRIDPVDLDMDFNNSKEKSLVSDRFGGRKVEMSNPEGEKKGVKEDVEEVTMESRWRKIREERGMGIWSKTNETEGGGIKLWKVPSLSHDEINSKADAFINKINTLIRLQRDDSLTTSSFHASQNTWII